MLRKLRNLFQFKIIQTFKLREQLKVPTPSNAFKLNKLSELCKLSEL